MTNLLKLLGILALIVATIFFEAWCLNLIYVSVVPLFAKFAVVLPELTYGMFVLIALVLSFFIFFFRNSNKPSKEDGITWFIRVLTNELVLLIYAACAAWASSVVFF